MNVTEFAEQIVFGKTLEDKLLVPGRLSFSKNYVGPNANSIVAPGRPTGLQMTLGKGGNVQPPGDDQLENEHARGQLLHFLANHELLATELMALVLLKFPNAPYAFRQGVLVTLQEEQEHTRMYIRRMKECGVEFGSFPLSGQFWRIVEPMKSPMDFVSRLSLTFEQANLDYSLHFANIFKRIGDMETSAVLQKIYEDEIGHVQHGLEWFRQWKNPEQSDWEAYQDSLEFPMSPNRGRGPKCTFNRDGRIQAGLTTDFINSIEVFRQSRGRTPEVYWFDPAAEAELASGLSPRELPLMDRLGQDLELVMVAIAKEDDVLLVRQMPSREMRKHLIDARFELPELVPFSERHKLDVRKLRRFYPWAWTPANHKIANSMIELVQRKPIPWRDDSIELFRKSYSVGLLNDWLTNDDQIPDWFSPVSCVGKPVFSFDEVVEQLSELAENGYTTALFKSDLAASGRGQYRLSCKAPLSEADRSWVQSVFANPVLPAKPYGVVEPELKRVVDLSFLWHWKEHSDAPNFLGWTRPLVTAGRRYAGTRFGTTLFDRDQATRRFVLSNRGEVLQTTISWLETKLKHALGANGTNRQNFHGYFGVDAFVYQDPVGELKVKPMVELNPRMTMGHIALNLKKRIAPGAEAAFRIFSKTEWESFRSKLKDIPLTTSRDGHWKTAVIQLGEFSQQTKLMPVMLVGKEALSIVEQDERQFLALS